MYTVYSCRGFDPFSANFYGQESGLAILSAQACLGQCLWETSPFLTFLSTNLVTNIIDRRDNHSCPSPILVVFRKEQQPPAMVGCYYALYFVLLRVRLIWLWLGTNVYILILITKFGASI